MIVIGLLLLRMMCDCFKSQQRLEAEILVLRHQLNVLLQHTPPLASQGFCCLLAVEIPFAGRPPANRPRGARPDPKNES